MARSPRLAALARSRRAAVFSTVPLVACLAPALSGQAKFGVHPHVAPIDFDAPIPGTSLKFNVPDGVWNHGEGFALDASGQPIPDRGGWHDVDDGADITLADNVVVVTDWTVVTNARNVPVERLVGYLRPKGGTQADGYAAETAFELFA